jgi:hypothetical protein
VSTKSWPFSDRPAKHTPLCPTVRGRRPFLSFHHQNKGIRSRGFAKNKTKVRGKCVMGMYFYYKKF